MKKGCALRRQAQGTRIGLRQFEKRFGESPKNFKTPSEVDQYVESQTGTPLKAEYFDTNKVPMRGIVHNIRDSGDVDAALKKSFA